MYAHMRKELAWYFRAALAGVKEARVKRLESRGWS
jgi:hypothetical protein